MSLMILSTLLVGVLWGRSMVGLRPLIRRGLPIASVLLGGMLFRQATRELGREAIENGDLNTAALSGIALILLGLVALLTLVTIYLGGQLGRAQANSRRRK